MLALCTRARYRWPAVPDGSPGCPGRAAVPCRDEAKKPTTHGRSAPMNHQSLSSFIWSVADLLRGDYKQSEYGRVILPFTVLRRLDCVLADTKAAVLAELAETAQGRAQPRALPAARHRARLLQPLAARHEAPDGRPGPHREQPGGLHPGLLRRTCATSSSASTSSPRWTAWPRPGSSTRSPSASPTSTCTPTGWTTTRWAWCSRS